ncbi:MAG: [LysW]-lysine hydrolase [Anaerolineae bacterium]|nr:[LysW]-lysine hydrolase [Anaerolineae bacterium]
MVSETVFDDAQAISLLTGLVMQYSPSTQERPVVDYLVAQMAALGLRAYRDEAGNAVGELGDGERVVLLLGHIDTVPGFIPVRRDGEILYGRGSVDAKGPLATFVSAAARAGARPGWRLVVVGAVEEEAATSKGARFLLDRLSPEMVVIGEPSHWDRMTVAYKGRLLADYTLAREIGHTAGPDGSACADAFAFWQQVQDYAATYNAARPRMFEQIAPALRRMHSEDDGFVEKATLSLSFRLPPELDVALLEAEVRALAGPAEVHCYAHEVAFRASKSTPLARAFIQAIAGEGGQAQFKVKSGTSDMNVVAPVWQCPILAYGPGDSSLDHTPNEHLDLDEYRRAIAVLTRVLTTLASE